MKSRFPKAIPQGLGVIHWALQPDLGAGFAQ